MFLPKCSKGTPWPSLTISDISELFSDNIKADNVLNEDFVHEETGSF
jgi:hypothetical protein